MEQFVKATDFLSAIQQAFKSADACHCHGPAKLSYNEVLNNLVKLGALDESYRVDTKLDDDDMFAVLEHESYAIKHAFNITTVQELCQRTFRDLMHVSGVGFVKARKIEINLAKNGFYLADGDPVKLRSEIAIQEAADEAVNLPRAPDDPTEVRTWAAETLFEIGQTIMKDGMSLCSHARRIDHNKFVGRELGMFINDKRAGHAAAAVIFEALKPLEDTERSLKRATKAAAVAKDKTARLSQPKTSNNAVEIEPPMCTS